MKISSKLYYGIFLVIGIIMCILFVIDLWVDYLPDYLEGFFTAGGFSLTAICTIILFNKSFLKKCDIAGNDERLQMIKCKSFEIAYFVVSLIGIVICVILGCLGEKYYPYVLTISGFIMAYTLVATITKFILSKKI